MDNVNIGATIAVFFLAMFLGCMFSSMLPLLSMWYTNSFLPGCVAVLLLNIAGEGGTYKYDALRDISYANIQKGVDIRYQFIYPLVCILLTVVVGFFQEKRDFLVKLEK